MIDRKHIISILKQAKPGLQKSYGFTSLALFGSYSRNAAIPGQSDIDVMVEFAQPAGIRFIDLADELEEILKQKVDLVSRKAIKPKYFEVIEPDLIYV
ncbi:MAG: nucleotidyltransferase family protein [Ginsengibacter sp.]